MGRDTPPLIDELQQCERAGSVRQREVRIEANGLSILVKHWSRFVLVGRHSCQTQSAQIGIEGKRIARAAQLDLRADITEQCDLKRTGYGIRNFSLQLEYITEVAVIGLRPKVESADRIVELSCDTNRLSGAPHATLEHRSDIQFVRNCAEVHVLPLERERRCARGDLQLTD